MADDPDNEAMPESSTKKILKILLHILFHIILIAYFIWCTITFILYDKKSDKCIEPPEATTEPELEIENSTESTETDEATAAGERKIRSEEKEKVKPFEPNVLCDINWCIGYGFLLIMLVLFYILWIYYILFKPYVGRKLYNNTIEPIIDKWIIFSRKTAVSIVLLIAVVIFVLGFMIVESRKEPIKLTGVIGPCVFIAFGFAVSNHRKQIPWRIVVHGILGQFILGICTIRLAVGRAIFSCAGDKVATFLSFTRYGSIFVYGKDIVNNFVFAFAILAVIFFFSVVTSCLFYLGIMQVFLRALGWLLQAMVGTTVCESVNAVGNIFLGMSESPMMIRPYIERLTKSELHSICVSGYSTVAGTVLGAFIFFGASPAYLITASVMAAPGSLAFSKLFYPETEESQTKASNIELEASTDATLLEAAASGAANGVAIVLGIVSNIIAFLAIIAFLDAIVEWAFEIAGIPDITFVLILEKMFLPIVFMMGVPIYDCSKIARIVAMKTVINEFVAYESLGVLIKNNSVDERSAAIATFAICGFANPGSLGILIAALSAMAPTRRTDITRVAFRAFFAGSITSFTSASFAGILIQTNEVHKIHSTISGFEMGMENAAGYFLKI